MDASLLEKLNCYLISKGKTPKKLNQNFLKANANSVKKTSLHNSKRSQHDQVTSCLSEKKLKLSDNKVVGPSFPLDNFKENIGTCSKVLTPIKINPVERKKVKVFEKAKCADGLGKFKDNAGTTHSKVLTPVKPNSIREKKGKEIEKVKLSHLKALNSKHHSSPAVITTKKLVRRSMNFGSNAANTPSKVYISSVALVNSSKPLTTPKQNVRKKVAHTAKTIRNKTMLPEKKSKTPKSKQETSRQEKLKRLEQLNAWLVAKGKDPTALCGFKPGKAVLTPVNSPAKKETSSTHNTQWPSLREEDYHDELSVLVNQTMKEAQACLKKDCSVQDVLSQLTYFKEKVSVTEKHACFWITLSQVYQKMNKNEKEILSLFESALECRAQPEGYIKEALKEYVQNRIKLPETSEINENKSIVPIHASTEGLSESPTVAMLACKTKDHNLSAFNKSKLKQRYFPISPLVNAESPSSVVRLRMVPKSSPVFSKIASRKDLPNEVNAIITPVRRSKRIENSKWSYPKGLLCPEKCVSTPMELMTAIEGDQKSSQDFVFDINKALGDEYSDIQKVLHF